MIKNLTRGNPAKVILLFSFPIILGNIFQQLYSVVDTVIVGKFVNYEALAGVGITNGMTFLVFGFVIGISSGFGIRIAQHFGAGNYDTMRRSVATSYIIGAALTVVLTIVALAATKPMLNLINTPESIYGYAYQYMCITFMGLFSQVAYNLISSILRALGDSKTPLYFLMFCSVLNVFFDILFVKYFGWEVKGAAYATILSQTISATLCFAYVYHRYPQLRLSKSDFKTSWAFIWDHLRIGLPMAFQFSITAAGVIIFFAALNTFPTTYIAGFTAASKIQNLGMLIPISFGVAIATYVGQNFGAGNILRMRRGVLNTSIMTLIVCVGVSLLMVLLARPLTSLFLDENTIGNTEEIFYASCHYLYVSATFFPFLFLIFVFRNALQGVGKTFWPLMAGVSELVIRAVASSTLPKYFGYDGIVVVDVLSWVGACTMLLIAYIVQMPKFERDIYTRNFL